MAYSVEVCYPEHYHCPSDSFAPCSAIISGQSIINKKLSLSAIVNAIFDGDHDRFFGVNGYIKPGDPSHITLSNTRWQ